MAEKTRTLLRKMRFLETLSRRGDLSGLQWSIAVMLTSLCGTSKGYAYPTFEMMARNLGATERGVRKAVDELERKGCFTISRGRGCKSANRYSPRFDLVPAGNIYDLEKRNASSGFDDPSDTPSEGLPGPDGNRNSGAETGTGVPQNRNGRSLETGTDGAANRRRYPGNVSEECSNRSFSKGAPDGAPPCSLSQNRIAALLRETSQRIKRDGLQGLQYRHLENLETDLQAAAEEIARTAVSLIDGSPEANLYQWAEALLGDVKLELEDRDERPFE